MERKIVDYLEAARSLTQNRFAASHPHPFLVGTNALTSAGRLAVTAVSDFQTQTRAPAPLTEEERSSAVQVFGVQKVQSAFTDMITIGRSANNDIVIADSQVSKFHAYFRNEGGELCLFDGGSANGTFIGGERLAEKGKGVSLRSGDHVRFGALRFDFLDAAACFTRLKQLASRL
jgi:hypothetical protein